MATSNICPDTDQDLITCQHFLGNVIKRFEEFSISSLTIRSTYSLPTPRISRKKRKKSSFKCLKTSWPIPLIQAIFLPDFKLSLNALQCYSIVQPIAKGAFGMIYKVFNVETKTFHALKIINKTKIIEENCVAQVKDEVKINTLCGHHPFIIDSPKYWQDRSRLYIVSGFMPGGDLYNLSDKFGILPEEIVKIYIAELASALDFLHNAGVIYRDLKAENVLLDERLHTVLIDFGLSKWLCYGEKTFTICGTLLYMAPEIFQVNDGCDGYGHAVDWWSLGVLSCLLLTKQYPERGNTEIAGQLIASNLQLISEEALDLIRRLLEVNPNLRLKNLYKLKTIKFFYCFNIDKISTKQIDVIKLFEKHFPNTNIMEKLTDLPQMVESDVVFNDFTQHLPCIV